MRQQPEADGAADNSRRNTTSFDALLQSCLPSVRRWAHGRLPRAARSRFDTQDLVQEAAMRMLGRRGSFTPRHANALQAYMRLTVMNLIRDEARRIACRPTLVELPQEPPCARTGPLQLAMRGERRARYEEALKSLRTTDRQLISARVDEGRSMNDIAKAFRFPSPDAARMAATRALKRLVQKCNG